MTERHAPTDCEIAAIHAVLDQATAEIENVRAHLLGVWAELPEVSFSASRSASIVSGITGKLADELRDLAARQSMTDRLAS